MITELLHIDGPLCGTRFETNRVLTEGSRLACLDELGNFHWYVVLPGSKTLRYDRLLTPPAPLTPLAERLPTVFAKQLPSRYPLDPPVPPEGEATKRIKELENVMRSVAAQLRDSSQWSYNLNRGQLETRLASQLESFLDTKEGDAK